MIYKVLEDDGLEFVMDVGDCLRDDGDFFMRFFDETIFKSLCIDSVLYWEGDILMYFTRHICTKVFRDGRIFCTDGRFLRLDGWDRGVLGTYVSEVGIIGCYRRLFVLVITGFYVTEDVA